MAHRLLLPLPPAFSPPNNDVEAYSVFEYDVHSVSGQQPQLQAYIDRLEAFLRRTRLIQFHPEDFFRIFLPNEELAASGKAEKLLHLDGSVVQKDEVAYMRGLCEAFSTLVSDDNALLGELHSIISEGPPVGAAAPLRAFFSETKALQMNRQRRSKNDAASMTLRTTQELSVATSLASSSSHAKHVDADATQQQRRTWVMESVLGHGMGKKKQHEVSVMRDTIVELVDCCNSLQSNTEIPPLEPVETVLNFGEGKGYVSRALALCDGLQVVGLDCNPAHKERAMERMEFLLQGRLCVDAVQGASEGHEMLNFMYEPRGHMAAVACRVEPRMNWAKVLRGHVHLSDETTLEGCVSVINTVAADRPELEVSEAPWASQAVDGSRKLQCRICPYIARRGAVMALMRHARYHLQSDDTTTLAAGLPSKETLDEWNRKLSVETFKEKVITAFFTEEVCYNSNATADGTTPGKRCRVALEGGFLCGEEAREKFHDILNTYEFSASVQLSRGIRAEVLVPVKQEKPQPQQEEQELIKGVEENGVSEDAVYRYVQKSLTVVGYDYAPNRHFVIMEDARQKEAVTLLQSHYELDGLDGDSMEKLHLPPAVDAWDMKLVVLLRVIPPLSPRMPVIHVPDLRNVVMIGLHPCGDLGSSVCRHFAESASRGLLLVSCCWHALTNKGFPLSRELQGRSWQTSHLSLLLATQPYDMWSTVCTEGHRDSTRVHFYRSLLKLLWKRLRGHWCQVTSMSKSAMPCCPFVEVPHLEPAFLRRIAKIKSTITMEALYVEVCREYISGKGATAKGMQSTWQQNICSTCREEQTKFLVSDTNVALAAEMGREFFAEYFSPFLGLTILRMWMCHLVETLLLLDRALFLSEALREDRRCRGSVVSLVPLFDGAISPRMYGVLARRIPLDVPES